ncbi:MAG: tRNA lysidine(34) synthetase TilS [Pseudomonadota bacterium]
MLTRPDLTSPETPGQAGGSAAVSAADFASWMAPFALPSSRAPLAVGLSGGSDSLALLHLLMGWARAGGGGRPVRALIVDHGLRSGSDAAAEQAAGWARAAGADAEILRCDGLSPGARLQEAARAARLRLLAEACAQSGAAALCLGHTMDDQAETVLQRLNRGAGVAGLAAMRPESWIAAGASAPVRVLRPFLKARRSALQAMLGDLGHGFLADPANDERRFERVRLRRALSDGEAELSVDALARTADRARLADDALRAQASALIASTPPAQALGLVEIPGARFHAAPLEVQRRAIELGIGIASGGAYPPPYEGVLALAERASGGGFEKGASATLAGCALQRTEAGFAVFREPSAVLGRRGAPGMAAIELGGEASPRLWDRRYAVRWTGSARRLHLRPLGEDGLRQALDQTCDGLALSGPIRAAALSAPGVFEGEALIASAITPRQRAEAAGLDFSYLGWERLERTVVRL